MKTKHRTKLVHAGPYVAKVDVELTDEEAGWSPQLSVADAQNLDDGRDALRRGDIMTAARFARPYSLTPVAVDTCLMRSGRRRHERTRESQRGYR